VSGLPKGREVGQASGVAAKPSFPRFLLSLLKVGLTAYGGPAIVAALRQELVLKQKWVSEEEFAESLAFAQLVPGPVVPATAAHAAQRLFGPPAAFAAALVYAFPAFALMLALSMAYFRWGRLPAVEAAFAGLGPVIVGIVAASTLSLAQPALRDLRGFVLAACLGPLFAAGWNPLLVVLRGALVGLGALRGDATSPEEGQRPRGGRRQGLAWGTALALLLSLFLWALLHVHPLLGRLALEVAKISLLAFGGGYTAVALMYHAFVETHPPLLEPKVFVDGLALGQLTPGPVVITSTFLGYKVAGLAGALVAALYTFLPPSVLVAVLAPQVARLRQSPYFRGAVRGASAAFVALLLQVLALVSKGTLTSPWAAPAALAAFLALRAKVPVLALIAFAVVASLTLQSLGLP